MKQMLHTTKFVTYETFVIILLRRGVVYLHTVWFLLRQDRPCRAFGGKGGRRPAMMYMLILISPCYEDKVAARALVTTPVEDITFR